MDLDFDLRFAFVVFTAGDFNGEIATYCHASQVHTR